MNRIPGGLDTDRGPPMTVPFQHFLVGMGFLVVGVVGGTVASVATFPGLDGAAHVHVTLVGWICLTIMGAMTQFVPVWSGVSLHSRRLAVAQLWLVAGGLLGFVAALGALALWALPIVAALMLAGFWLFVYNVGRTLWGARPLDYTERHFALALVSFALLAPLGFSLAVDFASPVYGDLPVARGEVLAVHATLAVFGGITATIVGAIAQLAAMFTQAERDALQDRLETLEWATFPTGLALLVVGRGLGLELLAAVGALGVLVGLLAAALALVRRLATATVDASPMTDRYWLVAAALLAWIALAAPAWLADPLDRATLLGHPDGTTLLVVGVFGFVVVGTLYHIVPFIVWMERYSDRVGLEPVPMIDDLYDRRIERADLAATGLGVTGLAIGELAGLSPAIVAGAGALATVGFCLFVANMVATVHRHGPGGLGGVLAGRTADDARTGRRGGSSGSGGRLLED